MNTFKNTRICGCEMSIRHLGGDVRLLDVLLEFREINAGDKNLEVIDIKSQETG